MKVLLFLFFATLPVVAQRMASVGFWNVENFFDTVPCPDYPDDDDWHPAAKQRWDTERYRNKCQNISRVLDGMALDVVGLAEIENEAVVRDLVSTLATDYNYIHRTAGRRARGRDIVLLYKGDRFVPHEVKTVDSRTSRSFLYVRGELLGKRVDIVVCHLPSMLNKYEYRHRAVERLYAFADSLHRADPGAGLVVMGDFNATPRDKVIRHAFSAADGGQGPLFCPLESAAAQGHGTYGHNRRWMLYDNIYLGHGLLGCFLRAGIYIEPYLLTDDATARNGLPLRTFTGTRYTNGFSDHLPVYAIFGY